MGKNDSIARQMAAAPIPERKPEPEIPAGLAEQMDADDNDQPEPAGNLKPNPFGFTSVIFKAASPTAKAFEETGRKSKKKANFLIEMGNSRAYLKGSIKAVMYAGRTKAVVEAGFFGAMNQGSCLACDDPSGQAALATLRADIVDRYLDWSKGQTPVAYVPTSAREIDETF